MFKNSSKRFSIIAVSLIAVGAVFLVGFYIGKDFSLTEVQRITNLSGKEEGVPVQVNFSPFWKVWNTLNDKYYATKAPLDQDKVWGAITGLTSSLGDPYTVFMPPAEKKSFEEQIRGNFDGVGMEVGMKDNILTVIAPLKGNPAEKAGIKAGDKILKINDKVTTGLTVDEAVKMIRGKKGTEVRLTLFREGKKEPFELKLIRDVITIPTVDFELKKEGVFLIRLANFSEIAAGLFKNALREFIQSGSNKLIIDLRGNPGGYLSSAVEMASYFLPVGKLVVEERGKGGEIQDFRSYGYNVFNDNLKMAILVDQGSASASEILAGALQEHGKAKLVGTRTFGKGSVQELVPITKDTSLKVTIARWFTPNGRSISEGGLSADYEIKVTEEDIAKRRDAQMEAAISLLTTGKATSTATTSKQN